MQRLILITVLILIKAQAFAQAPSMDLYKSKVSPFINKYCIDCHDQDTAKGDFVLDKLNPKIYGKNAFQWSHILDQLNLGEMPPKKKKQPSISESKIVIDWINNSLKHYKDTATSTGGQTVLRRLNRIEYLNTVRDLLNIEFLNYDPTKNFDKDEEFEGFDNVGKALLTSPNSLKNYIECAESILDEAIITGVEPESVTSTYPGNKLINGLDKKVNKNFSDLLTSRARLRTRGVQHSGIYLIKIKAQSIKNQHSELRIKGRNPYVNKILTLYIGKGDESTELKQFHFNDDKKKTIQLKVRLKKGDTLRLQYLGGPRGLNDVAGRLKSKNGVQGLLKNINAYKGPAIRIFEVQVNGPIYNSWPAPSHKAIFQGLKTLNDADVQKILKSFASRAFRRPVDSSSVNRYFSLYKKEQNNGLSDIDALKMSLKVILSSPKFLYLYENPGKLDDYAIACRLSYFFWSSMPDNELFRLAQAKKLSDPKVLKEQFIRLLKDPKSEAFIENFGGQWLGFRAVGTMMPDKNKFQEYYEGNLEEAIREESRLFFKEIVLKNLSVMEVVKANWTFLNERLARHYNIPGIKGDHFRKVKLEPEYNRGGILGHASLLTVTSNGTTTSPIVRGIWILENILGTPPPPPPPDVDPIEPDI